MLPFYGRRLLLSELPISNEQVHQLKQSNNIVKESGFVRIRGKMTCRRCHTSDVRLLGKHFCASCQNICTYCRNCLSLGKVSECTYLYRERQQDRSFLQTYESSLHWDGTLSADQKKASDAVVDAIAQKKSLLLWAVCGAGKTEMVYAGIERALQEGLRIVIATPRVDVVKELHSRLRIHFSTVSLSALYSGSTHTDPKAQLVISTTHQLMRYYEAFDVVIVDEVDAFPYAYDRSLQYAVSTAKKKEAARIYLTATPHKSLLKSNIKKVIIPRRYHGYPLPEPKFVWCGNWEKVLAQNSIPKKLVCKLRYYVYSKKQVLLFVTSIAHAEKVVSLLKRENIRMAFVHSHDEHRHEKIAAFRKQTLDVLVTTTILERGVTFANVQVIVLGAEQKIFTEAALVQIAGRVGRSMQSPDGDVIFYHYGISEAMRDAKRHIIMMNKEGKKR